MQIKVEAEKSYDIIIERGILAKCGELIREVTETKTAAIITDSVVAPLYLAKTAEAMQKAGFDVASFVFPAGEQSKSHKTLLEIYSFLAQNGITRKSVIVALGGGVVGDITGYAAATYLRGVPFVQIPTTFLAQIDSSVGGKTAVDLPEGKNLVGAFYQPLRVLIDSDTLSTLPKRIFADGMAEAIKYGAILDESLFGLIADNGDTDSIIAHCVSIKAEIVRRDEFDTGERMLLNFGHTLGHAVEQLGEYASFTHGEGVAIGMVAFARFGEKHGITEKGTSEKLVAVLEKYGLPTENPYNLSDEIPIMMRDKKRADDSISIVALDKIGESKIIAMKLSELTEFLCG